jgi:hypothetical protein
MLHNSAGLPSQYLENNYLIDQTTATTLNSVCVELGSDGCLYIRRSNKVELLSNFTLEFEKKIIEDDGQNRKYKYRMKCILAGSKETTTMDVTNNDLMSDKWISKKLDIRYIVTNYKIFKRYISSIAKNINIQTEFTHCGWRKIGNKYVYLHGYGAIGSRHPSLKSSTDKNLEIDPQLSDIDSLNSALSMLNISTDLSKTLPLFLYTHLAVMKALFIEAGAEPKFVLWIHGKTGSFKTTISKLFFNIFNRSKSYLTGSFKDTNTAIEIKGFEHKDCIFLIDDFYPEESSSQKEKMKHIASDILRYYGDGICKSRSTPTLQKNIEFPQRGLAAITGEDTFGSASDVARYIGIEVQPGDYNANLLSLHQRTPLNFSTHMYYFIEWVADNFESIVYTIKSSFPKYRDEFIKEFSHKRFCEAMATFALTADILGQYINVKHTHHYKTSPISFAFINEWQKIMVSIISKHDNSIKELNPAIMYLTALQELLATNKCKLHILNETFSTNANIIGYMDQSYYYLMPKTAFSQILNFWKCQDKTLPLGEKAIYKVLDELGIIRSSVEGGEIKRTIKYCFDGYQRKRYLAIDINKMNTILSNI